MTGRQLDSEQSKTWLTKYKFKDWIETKTRQQRVTEEMKEQRASEIAHGLNDPERWLTHGRGIDMKTLRDEMNLEIDDIGDRPELRTAIWGYFSFLRDYMMKVGSESWVHTLNYF